MSLCLIDPDGIIYCEFVQIAFEHFLLLNFVPYKLLESITSFYDDKVKISLY